ncbi:MAG TPA: multiheme c-type cytochrome [Thermoanaerobaculia bacterium]|nr:multiheme c-type cytochrome [Thermoanaerobaculia bacterium]
MNRPCVPRTAEERAAGWGGALARFTGGTLAYLLLSGLAIRFVSFSALAEWTVIVHSAAGVLSFAPLGVYLFRHWRAYRADALTPAKVLGWFAFAAVAAAEMSGFWAAGLALFSRRVPGWVRDVHLIPSIAVGVFAVAHLWPIWKRKALSPDLARRARALREGYLASTVLVSAALLLAAFPATLAQRSPRRAGSFPKDYRMPFGKNRPFAPSLARTEHNGALAPEALSGSASCGSSGCHESIYREWSVSAHRWAALDPAFQRVQEEMARQNGPESTRYCGGCHDPISLFSGSKTVFKADLTSDAGMTEGVSCLSCHSVGKADVQGNANYVVHPPERYLFETSRSRAARLVSDFLIRAYPKHHVASLEKRLFKTPEYCAACHKQFVDQEVNNFGWVQLQNQYDNWRKSKWNHPGDPRRTIECRECHMPLLGGPEPASGDTADYNRTAADGQHRSHRFLGANQYMPALLKLPGGERQVELVDRWLHGSYPVPEIASKWAAGPAVSLALDVPSHADAGRPLRVRAIITSNKVGHDYPTGPLDLIQSWIEIDVRDASGAVVFTSGRPDAKKMIPPGSFLFKAEPVDRYGNLIDRHNLWEMVGVRYRRSLFPGYSDVAEYTFTCPSSGGTPAPVRDLVVPDPPVGAVSIEAILHYRKLDQFLVDFLFPGKGLSAPITDLARARAVVHIVPAA